MQKLVIATCQVETCSMFNDPIPCGDPLPTIICGGCGTEITDKVEADIPQDS